jgi:hypothetical protein
MACHSYSNKPAAQTDFTAALTSAVFTALTAATAFIDLTADSITALSADALTAMHAVVLTVLTGAYHSHCCYYH